MANFALIAGDGAGFIAAALNYDHVYHAGNPADVFKHASLSLILRELIGRADPIFYLETHAGAGRFFLDDPTGEWTQGIEKLASKSAQRKLPELSTYLGLIGERDGVVDYPGSPRIAQEILRDQDRLELYELNKRDHDLLRKNMGRDGRVKVHSADGYGGLMRAKPGEGERLVALIDPPFESLDEWDSIREVFVRVAARTGVVLILWYPIKAGAPHEGRPEMLREALEQAGVRGLSLEVRPRGGLLAPRTALPKVRGALAGTGLIFSGAPQRAIARISSAVPELARTLAREEDQKGWEATWIGWG